MKRMESPSAVGVAIATARVVPEVIAVTTTGTRVAGTTVCRVIHLKRIYNF
jgi:hypothetical protein